MSKNPCRHKETWWWSEEIAEAVREKDKVWKLEEKNSTEPWKEYKKRRQNAQRVISSAKEKKQKESASDLNDSEHFSNGKKMTKERIQQGQSVR